jgi:hypothetical protein
VTDAELCLANSVSWYGAMFRAHGLRGDFEGTLWSSRDEAPPYHSNAVTIVDGDVAAQTRTIAALRDALRRPFTVKDSYARLDLAPLGFDVLFDATWVLREPSLPPPTERGNWRRVTAPELPLWEAAWKAAGSPADGRVFPPAFLGDATIALFGAYRSSRLVAGFASHRSLHSVGFSNYFGDETLRASAVTEAMRLAQDAPLVGYDHGDDLTSMLALGFRAVGPLRVWTLAPAVAALRPDAGRGPTGLAPTG